jgi:hypothetical protein
MTANEWLGVMKQAQDFPKGMEKLIVKYGEMLIAEHESKVKKLTIPDVSGLVCLHEWDEGFHNVSKCKKCGKYSA